MSLADRLAKASQRDRIADVRLRVQERLVEVLGPRLYDSTLSDNELEGLVHQRLRELLDEEEGPLSSQEKLLIVRQIGDSVLGLGPLEPFVRDPDVSEIMVNGWDTIYVERAGKLYWTGTKFHDEQQLRRTIDKIVGKVGRRVDEASPYVDARLPDGSRVNAIIPPLSIDGPALTIRKFSADPFGADDLIEFGTMTSQVSQFLEACVRGRINILVSGGTGAGKTSTLNVLSSFIPDDERIITIEDAAELRLQQPHVIRLESRPPNIEGKGQVAIRDLVRNALRMRPDRIVVGEVRDAAALDMLQAMNTGHDGSISTIHSNSPRDSLSRLETITMMAGMELSPKSIREQISSAIQLIVHQQRLKDGSRRFTHVTEIEGMEGDVDHPAGPLPVRLRGRHERGGQVPRAPEVHGPSSQVRRQAGRARRLPRRRDLRARLAGQRLMTADAAFWGTQAALGLAIGLATAAAFLLGVMLFGTASRRRQQKIIGERMAAVGNRGRKVTHVQPDSTAGGWIPARVTNFGRRFADARGFSGRLDAELEAADVSLRSGEFVIVTVGAAFVGPVRRATPSSGARGSRSASPSLAGLGPTAALKLALGRRAEKLREQLPDVLTIMASSLRAGHSFLQALDTTAKEIAQPAATEFQRVVAEIRLGRSAEDALGALAERVGSADFKWAVLAVNIQREVGGNLAEILDNVADTLRERATMRRQIRVLTSEGRLSAWLLALMPFGIALYMFVVNKDYIMLLFTTKIGLIMLGGAAIALVVGILWMRKIVDIDV